jgi:hypothetical protein
MNAKKRKRVRKNVKGKGIRRGHALKRWNVEKPKAPLPPVFFVIVASKGLS